MYKTILFDLDGTLTDSGEGIIHSVKYALEKMNLDIPTDEGLHSFIGPPLNESFKHMYQLNELEIKQAITYYRRYYQEFGIYENQLYKGIVPLLKKLTNEGFHLYIATSKPEVYAKKILAYFELSSYFKGIYGATLDDKRSKKAEVINYALKQGKISNINETIMIGDRSHDMLGAAENKLASIGVLYGYGSKEELEKAGAVYLATTPKEIEDILTKENKIKHTKIRGES